MTVVIYCFQRHVVKSDISSSHTCFQHHLTLIQQMADSSFQPEQLGFFKTRYQGKTAAEASALENTDDDTIYRDVNVFMSRAKDYGYAHS